MSETLEGIVVDVSKMETTTPTSEKSSVVGNAAAMREALLEASIALSDATHHHLTEDDAKECISVIESAIAKPPRNCDAFSKTKILEMLEDRSFSKEDTIEWLFAEAKGDTE